MLRCVTREELQALGLPIWARWIRVRGATKTVRGTLNEPVVVGGATITAGDIVILDADGAVVVARQQAQPIWKQPGRDKHARHVSEKICKKAR